MVLIKRNRRRACRRNRMGMMLIRRMMQPTVKICVKIGESGAVPALIPLLRNADPWTQEHAVTALLNLSLLDENKPLIAGVGAVKSLIYVPKTDMRLWVWRGWCYRSWDAPIYGVCFETLNVTLGLELVDPSRDLGLWVAWDSTAAARRKRERSSSLSGKEMGGGGEERMCEANKNRIGRDVDNEERMCCSSSGKEMG